MVKDCSKDSTNNDEILVNSTLKLELKHVDLVVKSFVQQQNKWY